MKKVLKPQQLEEAIYYSDFSGKIFKDSVPVTVKIECSYGSKYDGSEVELHLTDIGLEKLLEFFKANLCQETKNELQRNSHCQSSDSHYNNKELYQKLI